MKERNLCVESGCKALCCEDPEINMDNTMEAAILKWFPNAEKMSWRNLFRSKNANGVYYMDKGNGAFLVEINGWCPNLGTDFNCSIQDTKPPECKDFERGQDDGSLIRLDANLKTFRQWDFEQSRKTSKS